MLLLRPSQPASSTGISAHHTNILPSSFLLRPSHPKVLRVVFVCISIFGGSKNVRHHKDSATKRESNLQTDDGSEHRNFAGQLTPTTPNSGVQHEHDTTKTQRILQLQIGPYVPARTCTGKENYFGTIRRQRKVR